jgi:hypothetical protein
MATQEQMLDEAYRRNLLPPDMKSAYEEARKRGIVKSTPGMSAAESYGTGWMDIPTGITQGLERLIGPETFTNLDKWLDQHGFGTGLSEALKKEAAEVGAQPGNFSDFVRKREQSIQQARGPDAGIDWARLAGNITPTLPLLPELMAARPIMGGAAVGSLAGAAQPVTGDDSSYLASKGLQVAGGAAGGAAGGVLGKAAAAALSKAGSALARRFPDNIEFLARRKLLERVAQDQVARRGGKGGSPAEIANTVRDLQGKGIPQTVADVAGPNVQALAGNVLRSQGAGRALGRETLEARDKAEGEYLIGVVQRDLEGADPSIKGSAFGTRQALEAKQKAEAGPAYRALAQHSITPSELLDRMLNDDLLKGALKQGLQLERNLALARGEVFDAGAMGINPGSLTILNPQRPNMRILDTVKQGLDAMVEGHTDAVTGKLDRMGYSIDQVRRAFLEEVDRLDTKSVYKAARAKWAGPVEAREAMEFGESVFKLSPEEIAYRMGQLSDSEKEFARHGTAQMVIRQILKTRMSADEAKAIVGTPYMRRQLAPLFKSADARDRFFGEMDHALQRFERKYKLLGGSPTAERTAEDTAPVHEQWRLAAQIGHELTSMHPFGALRAVGHLLRWWRDMGFHPDEEMNEQLARILFGVRIQNMPELARTSGQVTKAGQPLKGAVLPKDFRFPRQPPMQTRVFDPASRLVRSLLPRLIAGSSGPVAAGMEGE